MRSITHSIVRKDSVRGVTAAGRTRPGRRSFLTPWLSPWTNAVTDNVKPQLAHIANKHWLTPEKLKPMTDKHKQPANCSDVVNSWVNPEIWGQLNAAKKNTDLRLANMQQAIQKVAFITLQTADSLLAVMLGKDPDKVKTGKQCS